MRRRTRRPISGSFSTNPLSALPRLIALLFVVALLFSWARKPESWQFLLDETDNPPTAVDAAPQGLQPPAKPTGPAKETITPGPTDQDPKEAADARRLFQAVSDRAPLVPIEMPAYWKLMKWARAQSFADMARRASDKVAFTQLFEQPDLYRGKLLRLRLLVRQIVEWHAAENSAGVNTVYEASGSTNESKSLPYIVVVSELPPGIKVGTDLREDVSVVGYFLKTMSYTTGLNRKYAAPLLIGRLQPISAVVAPQPIVARNDWLWIAAIGVPAILLILLSGVWLRRRRSPVATVHPPDETQMEDWFRSAGGDPLAGPSEEQPPRD